MQREAEQHIVYAVHQVLDFDGLPIGKNIKIRVSEPMSWGEAIDRHTELERERRLDYRMRAIPSARVTAARLRVGYFAVRSADDPDWPATEPCALVRAYIGQKVI